MKLLRYEQIRPMLKTGDICLPCKHTECPLLSIGLILVSKDKYAIVDRDDYAWASTKRWFKLKTSNKRLYASRNEWISGVPRRKANHTIIMHREIMGTPDGMETDHINGNGLDNRKSNLRICTKSRNMHNQQKTRGSSRYKGVYWNKHAHKWHSSVTLGKQRFYLGIYNSEEDAALAYNNKAKEIFGEFARLNNIPGVAI